MSKLDDFLEYEEAFLKLLDKKRAINSQCKNILCEFDEHEAILIEEIDI